jgi:hypothetical protein
LTQAKNRKENNQNNNRNQPSNRARKNFLTRKAGAVRIKNTEGHQNNQSGPKPEESDSNLLDSGQTLLAFDEVTPESCFIVYGIRKDYVPLSVSDVPQPLVALSFPCHGADDTSFKPLKAFGK